MLALRQYNSAEFLDKEEIIAPVITVWERFSVAENQQMSKQPGSLQPISCSSYVHNWEPCGQVIKGFHTCDYTVHVGVFWGCARESFQHTMAKKYSYSLCCSPLSLVLFLPCLCSVSPSPHHLCLFHHYEARKPGRALQPDLFNVPSSCTRCVRARVRARVRVRKFEFGKKNNWFRKERQI